MTQPKTTSRSFFRTRTLARPLARHSARVCVWSLVVVMLVQFVAPATRAAGAGARSKPAAAPRRVPQGPPPYVIFGPEQYDVTVAGGSVNYETPFERPLDAAEPYVVRVVNGNPDGSERVKSGSVVLDNGGRFPVTVAELDTSVGEVNETVLVRDSNVMLVELAAPATGQTTAHVTVTVEAVRATLASIDVTSGAQASMATVTLHGTNTSWLAGYATASFGSGISVGGAAEGEPGPVTVIDETTATATITVATAAALGPRTVTAHSQGGETVSLVDGFTVRPTPAFSPSTMTVGTLAGTAGVAGFADGPAATAQFDGIAGIAVGPDGAIYVADSGNNRIRVVREEQGEWVVSTLAGDGTAGYVDGPGATARFDHPKGIAVDASGYVYVADTNNHRIRQVEPNGVVTTLAGTGVAGSTNGAPQTAQFNQPDSIAFGESWRLYIGEAGNQRLREWDMLEDQILTTTKGVIAVGGMVHDDGRQAVYLTNREDSSVLTVLVEQRRPAEAAPILGNGYGFFGYPEPKFAEPSGLAMEGVKVLVADTGNSLIRRFDPDQLAFQMQQAETLAGSGERGYADGRGDLAKFNRPGGVAATAWGAIVVADGGNHVLRLVLRQPTVTSIVPGSGHAGDTVTISGTYFDGRGPAYNAVRFAKAGGGTVAATVTSATQTALEVVVPAGAVTGAVEVETQGGTAEGSFTVLVSAPAITGFTPTHGPVGTTVTVTGTDLDALQTVTFAGAAGRIGAAVVTAGANQIQALVPNGAVTGVIEVTTARGQAETASAFVVDASQEFALTVAPTSVTAARGTTATVVVSVDSSDPLFNHLVSLTTDAIAGVTASFEPRQITAGASSTLRLKLASTLATGDYTVTVRGRATIDGAEQERTAEVTVHVGAGGQTALLGRVISGDDLPIVGATVSLDGQSATTDGSGSFTLTGITAGPDRPVMVDGRTASAPGRTYPVVVEPVVVVAGLANEVPFTFYLPAIDVAHQVPVETTGETVVTTPMLPGLKLTIPAGANLRMPDGTAVSQVSLTPVPIDRTPAPLPPGVSAPIVFTAQPGGAVADVSMPVEFPNMTGADPGKLVDLYAFNHIFVRWEKYGTGHVNEDGTKIIPDTNPADGRPYGLTNFSWGFPAIPPDPPNPGGKGGCPCSTGGRPVNYPTGMKEEAATDVAIGGARGGLELSRMFTSGLARNAVVGQFGLGWRTNYDYALVEEAPPTPPSAGTQIVKRRVEAERMGIANLAGKARGTVSRSSWRVITPEDGSGRLFNYVSQDEQGTKLFKTTATLSQLGDELRQFSDGHFEYRYRDGRRMMFDDDRRLTRLIDRNGNTKTLTYDSQSRLSEVEDAVGRTLTFTRNTDGTIHTATDPAGRVWEYTYQNLGIGVPVLTEVESPDDKTVQYGWDSRTRLVSVTDRRGNQMKLIDYDDQNRVRRQTFADGSWEEYFYETAGSTISGVTIRNSLGRERRMRFDSMGYVVEEADELGQTVKIERDAKHRPVRTIGPCGCGEAEQTFDDNGNVLTLTDRLGHTTSYEYHPVFNLVTKVTDRNNHVTELTYDASGNLETIENALNEVTTFGYDTHGQLTSVTDALQHQRTLEYDAYGNVMATIDPLGHRREIEYDTTANRDKLGWPTAIEDALGRRTTVVYDSLGRVTESRDTANALTEFEYDENGNLRTVTDALNRTWEFTYDKKNRRTTVEDPLGRVTRVYYNANDEVLKAKSPTGRTVEYTYSARGEALTAKNPLAGTVEYQYDAYGQLTSLTDERGNVTTYGYDELHRPVSMRDPVGRTSTLSYDHQGNLTGTVDRLGRQTTFLLDALDRPETVSYVDATVTYHYDDAGRLEGITDTQSGALSRTYDDANRLLTEGTPNGLITYTYNNADQMETMTAAPAGGTPRAPVVYGYDTAGRLHTITQGAEVFTYAYDTLSRLESLTRANGTNTLTTGYEFDVVNRLKRLHHTDATTATIEDFRYTYTPDDEIATITSIAGTPVKPPAVEASTADAANRLTQFGGTSYDYDEEGQTTTRSDAEAITNLTWDSRGRLTSATLSTGATVEYSYDAIGRLSGRSEGSAEVSHLYAGLDVVVDHMNSGDTDYLNGPGVDNKLRQSDPASGPLYFLQDHLGSTAAFADADGNVVEQQEYEPFGDSSGSSLTRYGYAGRERDASTKLIYNRQRWLDSKQGRFVTEDPLGASGGLNLYSYVGNNPVNYKDPLGEAGVWFGDYHLGDDEPWLIFTNESWMDISKGAAATLDGLIPFADPFSYAYADPCGKIPTEFRISQELAAISRDLYLFARVPNVGPWSKNPVMYEIGQKTLPTALYRQLAHMTPIERGKWLVEHQGWFKALFSYGVKEYGTTIGTGLTPGAWLGILGTMHGLDYYSRDYAGNCR